MVWGLCLPDGFGDGWPEGSFESDPKVSDRGWYERLKAHYLEQDQDTQKRLYGGELDEYGLSYPAYVGRKLTNELGSRYNQYSPPYAKIEAHEPPKFFHTRRRYKQLFSLIGMGGTYPTVDEDLKSIIEAIEPGVHKFYPLEIRMPAGKTYPKQYHTLVIGAFLDSFDIEQSKQGSAHSPDPGRYNLNTKKKAMAGVAFRKVDFGGHHLWRERTFRPQMLCFSDELHERIVKAELNMPRKFYQMAEI
jgi:hypothetical protein